MKEITAVSKRAASVNGDVASHLLHPLLCRLGGDPGDLNLSIPQMDEEQNIVGHQSPQREDLHGEKVSSRQHHEVSANEFCPRGRSLALRRRRYATTPQNIADRLIRNLVTQIG